MEAGGVSVAWKPRLFGLAGKVIPPDALLKVPGIEVKYMSDRPSFWKGLLSNIKAIFS